MIHFCVSLRESKYGYHIMRDNYAIIDNKNSIRKGEFYTDEVCEKHQRRCLRNYDLNMQHFYSLDKAEFNKSIEEFSQKYKFKEVFNLNDYSGITGYYILVLDSYCQAYIGTTQNIKKRILYHWSTIKPFDTLIFGNVNNSIISIDSFRALDTTRIFVRESDYTYNEEDKYIKHFPNNFLLNRTKGGLQEFGLVSAIANARKRELNIK